MAFCVGVVGKGCGAAIFANVADESDALSAEALSVEVTTLCVAALLAEVATPQMQGQFVGETRRVALSLAS